ncbi:AAA family ATPase [Bosea sp. (in: a-proteobacteria)]|uniref:AAA family ATPase n=1 Tax=Bosea sp. (in: a-proteobacteria) TaxID=1871050 RepID=UPI002FC691A7
MNRDDNAFFVITGGPGAGKTSLLAALAEAGYATAPEGGRAIIRDQVAIDGPGLPWRERGLFAELMLGWDMRSHAQAQVQGGPVFFDRGVPDVAGYLALSGLAIPAHIERAARQVRYRRLVFAAPPWRENFAQDAERKQDFAEAERTFAAVTGSYRDFGYEPVELPRASVAERLAFIRERIGAAG